VIRTAAIQGIGPTYRTLGRVRTFSASRDRSTGTQGGCTGCGDRPRACSRSCSRSASRHVRGRPRRVRPSRPGRAGSGRAASGRRAGRRFRARSLRAARSRPPRRRPGSARTSPTAGWDLDRHLRPRGVAAPDAQRALDGRARHQDDLPADLQLQPQPAVRAPRRRRGDPGRRAGAGLEVVAWYLPGFADLPTDLHRTMRSIGLRTKAGNGFDSFALDIESPEVRRPAVRTRRLAPALRGHPQPGPGRVPAGRDRGLAPPARPDRPVLLARASRGGASPTCTT
jgi:hypothetical protein